MSVYIKYGTDLVGGGSGIDCCLGVELGLDEVEELLSTL